MSKRATGNWSRATFRQRSTSSARLLRPERRARRVRIGGGRSRPCPRLSGHRGIGRSSTSSSPHRTLHQIPATAEGLAIQQMISEKRSINVTLIFSLERYAAVMEAYLAGLEAAPATCRTARWRRSSSRESTSRLIIASTRSATSACLEGQGCGRQREARLRVVPADLQRTARGARRAGARVQRPLWASTSTKNPDYSDTLYVDELIGPDTVNTLPDNTLEAFEQHGTVARTVDEACRKPTL